MMIFVELLVMFVVSMYFFPIEFVWFPGINTKMAMAAVGLVIAAGYLMKEKSTNIPRPLLIVMMISSMVSIIGFISVTYNQTSDYTYVSYVVSAAVWLSAAFVVCNVIKWVHGRLDVRLIVGYLTAVCVYQCVMALLIDNVAPVKTFVDSFVEQAQEGLTENHRLYGVGASLDTAGSRFSTVLVAISVLLGVTKENMKLPRMLTYIFSFFFITVVGNMIARTTIVGAGIGLAWLLFVLVQPTIRQASSRMRLLGVMTGILLVGVPVLVFLYNTSPWVNEQLRFAFEGFFSLVETGEWHVSSNDMLENMVVFPDNLKTWLIGDGYFNSAIGDVNFLGQDTQSGFYKGTDIGYCRFLFYFGIPGLLAITAVMVYTAVATARIIPEYKYLFLLVLVVGLVVWTKVATDVFVALAIYFVVALMEGDGTEEDDIPDWDIEEEASKGLIRRG